MGKDILGMSSAEFEAEQDLKKENKIKRKHMFECLQLGFNSLFETIVWGVLMVANFIIFAFLSIIYYEVIKDDVITGQGYLILLVFAIVVMMNCVLYGYGYVYHFDKYEKKWKQLKDKQKKELI